MTHAMRERRILRGMNNRIVTGLLACSITLAGCVDGAADKKNAQPAPPRATVTTPGTLQSAHEAYLDGDFLAVGERIRDVLLDTGSSDAVKQNAFELLDKAYEAQKGKMPSRFVLPTGFEGIKYSAVRGMSEQGPFFRISLYGHTRDSSHLKSVVVRRLPDETVLDTTPGKGKDALKLKHDKEGYDTFIVERVMQILPADGVLSVRFELDDGTVTEGFFITRGLTPSTSPEIRTPLSSSTISETHPIVSWVPFATPESAPYESRTLSVYLSREGASGAAWDFWTQGYGDLAQVRVGDHPPAAKTSLLPGDYWLNVSCGEGRWFGPVGVFRGGSTISQFHVVP